MKYSIEATTIEPVFKWEQDEDGDWKLWCKRIGERWWYWGLICPHHQPTYRIVSDDGLKAAFPPTLAEAQALAEEMCAGDILRDLAKIKKETA